MSADVLTAGVCGVVDDDAAGGALSGAGTAAGILHEGHGPRSLQFACVVGGQATDFVVTDFGSQLFVIITQSAKIGSLIEASSTEMLEGGDLTFDVRVLFGDRRAEHYRSYARAIIELIARSPSSKSLLLGIALREHSVEGMRQILRELRERIVSVARLPDADDDDLAAPTQAMQELAM
mmetsp:Transcript_56396/g.157163  ORF Transcript_56396/g.157163 Transcript_56396/m.157163 type:complete len:179 (-) Transcript_56396:93-629(-)